jgi:hypothetical protein
LRISSESALVLSWLSSFSSCRRSAIALAWDVYRMLEPIHQTDDFLSLSRGLCHNCNVVMTAVLIFPDG